MLVPQTDRWTTSFKIIIGTIYTADTRLDLSDSSF